MPTRLTLGDLKSAYEAGLKFIISNEPVALKCMRWPSNMKVLWLHTDYIAMNAASLSVAFLFALLLSEFPLPIIPQTPCRAAVALTVPHSDYGYTKCLVHDIGT